MALTRKTTGRRNGTRAMTDDYFALVLRCPLRHIRNDAELRKAHAMIDQLVALPEGKLTTGQAEYLDALGDLTSVYEAAALDEMTAGVTGLDVLRQMMEQHELNASDVGRLLGNRELGSKLIRGERRITRDHAAKFAGRFGIAAETFLR